MPDASRTIARVRAPHGVRSERLFLGLAGLALAFACSGSGDAGPVSPTPPPPPPPSPTPTPPPTISDHSLIVFQHAAPLGSADTNIDIWAVHADGTGLARLTSTPVRELHPALSPDTTKVAYEQIDPPTGLWMVTIATGATTALDTISPSASGAVWSPDSRSIMYSTANGVMIVGADGSSPHPIAVNGVPVSWSADGTQLLVVSGGCLTIVNADGSNPHQVPGLGCFGVSSPAWSPDGKRIAFSILSGGQEHIYTMSVNGDDPVQLTSFLIGADRTPTWSHDGKWIAFSHDSASQFNIFVVAADGGTPRRVTSEAGIDYSPSWGSP